MLESRSSKVRITATVHRLQINKNIRFQTKISWKRRRSCHKQTATKHKPPRSVTNTATPRFNKPSLSTSTYSTTPPPSYSKPKM